MKRILIGIAAVLLVSAPASAEGGAPHAESIGWRLGVQCFSFNKLTFTETVDKVRELGLKYVEAMPFGLLSPDHRDIATNEKMAPEYRTLMKDKLAAAGVKLINYGVVTLPNDEAAWRKVFDFATDMGIETITAEPTPDELDLVARLCDEYQINLAIHNHPIPSAYWNPQTVLDAVKGRTKRMGACADTSHWQRSGLDVVQCLKLLEGRIICFHFGEVDGPTAEEFAKKRAGLKLDDPNFPSMVTHVRGIPNVVYGAGPADMRAWLVEIRRQKIRAVFSIEAFFELNPNDAMEKMRQSIVYFDKAAAELGGK
jgi:sugar phosphate isomerase/epimerase